MIKISFGMEISKFEYYGVLFGLPAIVILVINDDIFISAHK